MFGYTEFEYTVERKAVIQAPDGPQTLELRAKVVQPQSKEEEEMWAQIIAQTRPEQRQPERDKRLTRYISVQGQNTDLLLLYQLHQAADLDDDWWRLVNEPKVDVRDLLCFEYVQWHGTGRTKDGAYIMY
jgi:hypothetical protein